MRLATITNRAYGVTLVFTLAAGATMLVAASAQEQERAAVAQRYALDRATSTIARDVSALGDIARRYAITRNPADLLACTREDRLLGPVGARTRHLRDAGAGRDELRHLHDALRWTDAPRGEQRAAIAARESGARDPHPPLARI